MYARASPYALAVLLGLAACSDPISQFAPPSTSAPGQGGAGGAGGQGGGSDISLAGGSSGPPAADAGGLCGNEIHPITSEPPTVYFIFDISGSMLTPVPGGTRFSVVRGAALTLVNNLRSFIKAGAAAFPLDADVDSCHIGGEVYPAQFDDPQGFAAATGALVPNGGTPTAATIDALVPKLTAIAGKTIAVLATDGGPNCNADASCTVSECTENIEGCAPSDDCCALGTNCCAPDGPAGPLNCIDELATVTAVSKMAAAGIKVYVIGIPGSTPYANVLTDMAFAGGTATTVAPYYYDVRDLSTLGSILQGIAGAQVSCDITIADPPPTEDETNVYLDQQEILFDPANGWTWSASDVVTLHGAACIELQSGQVSQVQVVTGCPTKGTT